MKPKLSLDQWRKKAAELMKKYKYVLLLVVAGLILLLWPSDRKEAQTAVEQGAAPEEDFSVASLEEKLSAALGQIKGAGDVTVMLTVQGGSRRVLAENESLSHSADGSSRSERSTVLASKDSSNGEDAVLVQQLYPRFQGALVVCEGADNASLRLKLMEAVSALTGLGADKISICEGKG